MTWDRAATAAVVTMIMVGATLSGCTRSATTLQWSSCGTTARARAQHVECASVRLPMDYHHPHGAQVRIALSRVPATDPSHRIGSLFFDPGGPGASSVDDMKQGGADEQFETVKKRFDIVAFDPRGVGESTPSIDCKVDEEKLGIYSEPVPTPQDIDVTAYVAKAQKYVDACLKHNGPILSHVSTANVARDLDALRSSVGDKLLTYVGLSYGTFIASTYANLFPHRYRALVLDGPVDADAYINHPLSDTAAQTAGFEDALSRFEAACAGDQKACSDFGGADPSSAFDRLLAAAQATPIPAPRYRADPRPVTGDDVREAVTSALYSKASWGVLGLALSQAAHGDASLLRDITDEDAFERADNGTYDPESDRYFTIGATEQRYPKDLAPYLAQGAKAWAADPHFSFNSGYAEISYGLWPRHDRDADDGPFTIAASSPTPLVVATTHDPATPYPGAQNLVGELGNARLLTMDGDGHTAFGSNSGCIDRAIDAYLYTTKLPRQGTVCRQDVAFTAPSGS